MIKTIALYAIIGLSLIFTLIANTTTVHVVTYTDFLGGLEVTYNYNDILYVKNYTSIPTIDIVVRYLPIALISVNIFVLNAKFLISKDKLPIVFSVLSFVILALLLVTKLYYFNTNIIESDLPGNISQYNFEKGFGYYSIIISCILTVASSFILLVKRNET